MRNSVAPSSFQLYKRAWDLFKQCLIFLEGSSNSTASVPLSVSQVALYVTYLHKHGYAPTSIVSYTSAIGYVHRISNVSDPTTSVLVQKILSSTLKLKSKFDPRLPITILILQRLIASLTSTVPSYSHRCLLRAMFSVAFFGLMRVGEITMSKDKTVPLDISQLNLSDSQALITITRFKHNKSMRSVEIPLPAQDLSMICPVRALQEYLNYRGLESGPLFALANLKPVPREFFIKHLRNTLSFCGFPLDRYKSHSFRIGGASYYAEIGFSDAQIRLLGRWDSDAFLKYIRSQRAISSKKS